MLRTPSPLIGALGVIEASMHNQSARDLAFRAVGRNLVNFQKLEHCLKALTRLGVLAGPMSTVEDKIEKRNSKIAKFTLGKAVSEWLRIADTNNSESGATEDLFEPWVSISFGLEMSSEYLNNHGQILERLATERNELVHHRLANFDFESNDECRELLIGLDSQNTRILEQLTLLAPAIKDLIDLNEWTRQPGLVDRLTEEFIRQTKENDT